jgi:hypothetical protein
VTGWVKFVPTVYVEVSYGHNTSEPSTIVL